MPSAKHIIQLQVTTTPREVYTTKYTHDVVTYSTQSVYCIYHNNIRLHRRPKHVRQLVNRAYSLGVGSALYHFWNAVLYKTIILTHRRRDSVCLFLLFSFMYHQPNVIIHWHISILTQIYCIEKVFFRSFNFLEHHQVDCYLAHGSPDYHQLHYI